MTMRPTDEQLREWLESLKDVTPEQIMGMTDLLRSPARGPSWSRACDALARCDPQTIGGMIEELRELREHVDQAESALACCRDDAADIRNAALDEAAGIARGRTAAHKCDNTSQEFDEGYLQACEYLEEAIFALKTPEESK